MSNPFNTVIIAGGLVDAPQVNDNETVANFRLAVDYAGQEQGSDNKSGYFNVKAFLNGDDRDTTFIKNQIKAGNFKKGSKVAISARLQQERWTAKDSDQKRSQVVLIAESISYVGSKQSTDGESGAANETAGDAALPANMEF